MSPQFRIDRLIFDQGHTAEEPLLQEKMKGHQPEVQARLLVQDDSQQRMTARSSSPCQEMAKAIAQAETTVAAHGRRPLAFNS